MARPGIAAGLYVHVPFCSVKCFYCDFTAFAGQQRTVGRYLAALEAEARLMPPRIPETLYIGGGTPSELSADDIARLFELIHGAYPGSRFREVTFEGNPESLDPRKLAALKDSGVTRLSLGLQTADDALLKLIGRRHGVKDFLAVFRAARRAGIPALNVDLMYGLPGQSPASHLASLDLVLGLGPEHLSLYGLQVEDRTLFGKRGVEPDEDLGREMFESSLEAIARAGYRQYEISNFARPGFESEHNRIYWRDGEYLGLGCGAASHLDGVRSANADRLIPYCEAVEAGRRPIAESESLSGQEKLGETVMLGLRLIEGLDLSPEMETAFAGSWRRLLGRGLIGREGPRVRLTREGVFLANEVFREFVAPFAPADKASPDVGRDGSLPLTEALA